MNIFKKFRDPLLELAEKKQNYNLRYPMKKLGDALNNYTRGDFIVVGGRKTSGKSSLILNNYVISPIIQRIEAKKKGMPFDLKVVYLNTRKNAKSTIERMIVNYISQKNNGTKTSVPGLYGYEGTHSKVTADKSKVIISQALNVFNTLSDKGILNTIPAKRSMFEIDSIIRETMTEYGEYDADEDVFKFKEEHKDLITIVAIDDISGIFGEGGSNNFKNDSAHLLASKLKDLAKTYNILIILGVPSSQVFSKSSGHRSNLDEVAPYGIYADRVIITHNPLETYEKQMMGYDTADFINNTTGVNYLRMIFVASNYMGPSGIYFGCFMFPENGVMIEMPTPDNLKELEVFSNIATKNNK